MPSPIHFLPTGAKSISATRGSIAVPAVSCDHGRTLNRHRVHAPLWRSVSVMSFVWNGSD